MRGDTAADGRAAGVGAADGARLVRAADGCELTAGRREVGELLHAVRNLAQSGLSCASFGSSLSAAGGRRGADTAAATAAVFAASQERVRVLLAGAERLIEGIMEHRRLRVGVIEDDVVTRAEVCRLLVEDGHVVVGEAECGDGLVRLVAEHTPDVVVFDIHLSGREDGLSAFRRSTRDAATRREAAQRGEAGVGAPAGGLAGMPDAPVTAGVVITGDEDEALSRRSESDEDILAVVYKPIRPVQLRTSVRLAYSRMKLMQKLHDEAETSRQLVEDRKTIDRAKAAVIREHGLSEPAVFRAMQKYAGREQRRIADVADDMLGGVVGVCELLDFIDDKETVESALRGLRREHRVTDRDAWGILQELRIVHRCDAADCARMLLAGRIDSRPPSRSRT